MSKLNSNWYSYEKKPYDYMRLGGLNRDADGKTYLFSKAQYKTKLTADDLPESYIYGRFYKRWGYLNTAGIVDAVYVPNKFTNHMYKDDRLVISYTDKLKPYEDEWGYLDFENSDFTIWSCEIIDVLKGMVKYSDYNIEPIIKQLEDKQKWLNTNYPDSSYHEDIREILSKPLKNYDSMKTIEVVLD